MHNRLFNLPSSILSDIYKFDDTYRDIFNQCHHDIWIKSFERFKYEFLQYKFFSNKPILKNKFKYLFEFLFENYDKENEKFMSWFNYDMHTENGYHSMFSNPMASDIWIKGEWKKQKFEYFNHKFIMDSKNTNDDIDDVDDDFDIPNENWTSLPLYIQINLPYYHKTNFHEREYCFRGNVLSNKHYKQNLKDEQEWDPEGFLEISHYGTRQSNYFELFNCSNDEYTITQNLYG
jgi:hypothetical protein